MKTELIVLKSKLEHAATRHDRARVNRRGYNPYALAQYLTRIDEAMADVESGKPLCDAIREGFNDRLRDVLLAAVDCEVSS